MSVRVNLLDLDCVSFYLLSVGLLELRLAGGRVKISKISPQSHLSLVNNRFGLSEYGGMLWVGARVGFNH